MLIYYHILITLSRNFLCGHKTKIKHLQTNKQYKWKMLDSDGKETDDPQEAVEIRTTYLENTLLNNNVMLCYVFQSI